MLRGEHAGDVPLRDMAKLMRQHRGQFGLCVGRCDQSGMHTNVASGKREGIDGSIFDRKQFKAESGRRRLGGQSCGQPVEVIDQFRIVEKRPLAADLAHDRVAQPTFGNGRKLVATGIAQARQISRLSASRSRRMQRKGKADQPHARPCQPPPESMQAHADIIARVPRA